MIESTRRLKASAGRFRDQAQTIRIRTNTITSHRSSSNTSATREQQIQQAATQAQHLSFINSDKIAETFNTLQTDLTKLEKDRKLTVASLVQKLNADDRVLDQIQLEPPPDDSTPEWVTQTLDRVNQLAQTLSQLRVQCVKDRLDRLYLENMNESPVLCDSNRTSDSARIEELRLEIRSLYMEVQDMATMVVNHQYVNGLRLRLDKISGSHSDAEQEGMNEVCTSRTRLYLLTLNQKISNINSMTTTLVDMEDRLNRSSAKQEIVSRMLQHLDAIQQQQHKHESELMQRLGLLDKRERSTLASSPKRNAAGPKLGSMTNENGGLPSPDDFEVFSSTLSEAAKHRLDVLQTLSTCSQEPRSASADLAELELTITEARNELESVRTT